MLDRLSKEDIEKLKGCAWCKKNDKSSELVKFRERYYCECCKAHILDIEWDARNEGRYCEDADQEETED